MTTQYIITDEQVEWWESGKPFSKEERKEMCKTIRSNPYNSQEQCGDNCNGECSGEVDGVIRCPYNPQAELESLLKSLKEAYCCNCSEETQSTCHGERCTQQEQIISMHDITIRQAEREKVLDEFDVWIDKYFSYLSNQKNIPKGLFSGFGIVFDFRQKLKELRRESKVE